MALKSGHYTPANHSVHVQTWPTIEDTDEDSPTFGEQIGDEDNLPKGFVKEMDSAGRFYYVHGGARRPTRHPITKTAVVLVPGGAVVTAANGVKHTMTAKEFRAFEAAHVADPEQPEPVKEESREGE